MPRSDTDRLNYLKTLESPEELKKETPQEVSIERTDEDRLKFLSSLEPGDKPAVPEQAGQPYDPRLTPEENQAAWVVSKATFPTVAAGVQSSGARALSMAYRVGEVLPEKWGGKRSREQADWYANYSSALTRAAETAGDQGVVKRGLTGALSNVVPMLAGGPAGVPAMIGIGVADQSNLAVTEGREAGLKGAELGAYVGRQGLIEGTVTGLMQKVGLGGMEKVLPGAFAAARNGVRQGINQTLKSGLKRAAKATARTLGEEEIEEVTIGALQMWNGKYSGVDKSKWSLDQVARTFADTTSAVAWTVVGGAGSIHLAENVKAGRAAEVEAAIISTATAGKIPSRTQWKEWGLDPKQGRTEEERASVIQQAAQQLQQQYMPQGPVAEPTQQVAPEAATEALTTPEAAVQEAAGQLPTEPELAQVPPDVIDAGSQQAAIEPTQPGPETASPITSVKNEVVTELREGRGEPPIEKMAPVSWEELLGRAEQQMRTDPTSGTRLIESLRQQPKNLEDHEVAVAQLHYRNLENQFAQADVEKTAAYQSNDPLTIKEAESKSKFILGEIQKTEQALDIAGTAAGRAFGARKILLRPDYSRAALIRRASVSKGKLLSEAETNQISELSAKVSILQKELDGLNVARDEQDTNAAVEAAIKQAAPKKRFQKQVPSLKKIEAQKNVQDAWAEFKRTLGPPTEGLIGGEAGALNVDAVAAGLKLAKAYGNLGITTFTEFLESAKTFIGDVAGVTTDTLRQSWEQARSAGYIPKLNLDPTKPESVTKEARRLVRSVVEIGKTDFNAVIDSVHSELQSALPDLTRKQAMDAIAGYGEYARMTKPELSAEVAQTKKAIRDITAEAKRQTGAMTEQYKKRLETKLVELERRISEGNFTKVARKETPLDKEATDLKWQIKQEMDTYKAIEDKWRREQLTGLAKAWDVAAEASNFSRAMMTSFDLSALGRQAGPAAKAHPIQAMFALEESLKAFASKEGEFASAKRIREHPKASLANSAKLAITVTEGQLTQQEEAYRGKWASKVPGVAGSERAYVTFLNSMRMRLFSDMVDSLGTDMTLDEAKAIANAVNVFTGRGYFTGANAAAAQTLSTYFFSPRFVVSRFQLLLGQPLWKGTLRTRKLVAKEYARYLAGDAAFYSLLGLLGYLTMGEDSRDKPVFEWNPLSPNFGKVRLGDTVIDPMSGLSQVTVLSSRLSLGETKKATGEIVPIRGEDVPFKGLTTTDVISRFLRSKLAPVPGAAWNILAGENMIGEKKNPFLEAGQLVVPLSFRDIYDTMQAKGFPRKAILSMLIVLGVGAQNYQDATPEMFARKIASHPQLRGYNKKEKKYYDYSTEVDQIIREAKKRGLKASDLGQALVPYMQKEGNKPETINKAMARLYARFNSSE